MKEAKTMEITNSLIKRMQAKDEEAFKIVYDQYESLIYYIALSITKNKQNAEEVVQDTFLKMLNSLDNYQHHGKFKEWITQIARNLSYNVVTRDKEKNTIRDETILATVIDEHNNIDIVLTIKGILDEQSAQIVILRIVYDFSFKEIAKYMTLDTNKVHNLYYSAMKKLKKEFAYE